jgi:hypothetical protein
MKQRLDRLESERKGIESFFCLIGCAILSLPVFMAIGMSCGGPSSVVPFYCQYLTKL